MTGRKGDSNVMQSTGAEPEMLLLQKAPEEMLGTHDVADALIVLMAHTQIITGNVNELEDSCIVLGQFWVCQN